MNEGLRDVSGIRSKVWELCGGHGGRNPTTSGSSGFGLGFGEGTVPPRRRMLALQAAPAGRGRLAAVVCQAAGAAIPSALDAEAVAHTNALA